MLEKKLNKKLGISSSNRGEYKITFHKWMNMDFYDIIKEFEKLESKSMAWNYVKSLIWDYITALRGSDFENDCLKSLITAFLRGKKAGYMNIEDFINLFEREKPSNLSLEIAQNIIRFKENIGLLHWINHSTLGLYAISKLSLDNNLQEIIKHLISILSKCIDIKRKGDFQTKRKEIREEIEAIRKILSDLEVI